MSGAGLRLEQLSLRLGGFQLAALDLALEPGEILVVLGPNGAGKSVMLEAIAGFHRIDSGRIRLGGRDLTGLPPERRRVSLLFQNFALFPHLTVAGNVGLALRAAGAERGRATALLERFGVAALAERFPDTLSPGEKQRVALARALAGAPELFLFDEPFSALDGPTRAALRDRLKEFLRSHRVPAIFVTHDHLEALALADRLALMRNGAILQQGSAADLYRRPASRFAAEFLGVENILPARLLGRDGALWRVAIGDRLLLAATDPPRDAEASLALGIRAEDVALAPADGAANRFPAKIAAIADAGALTRVVLDAGFPLVAALPRPQAKGLAPGADIAIAVDPASILLFD